MEDGKPNEVERRTHGGLIVTVVCTPLSLAYALLMILTAWLGEGEELTSLLERLDYMGWSQRSTTVNTDLSKYLTAIISVEIVPNQKS
ncbi:hypothetical protein PoB_006153300 [Plakobranchus ocellatus]|uniref:Uncharacterized protein n=1 Tax=Plakobranchus ocellatus TaxID=259542 RepID=A0AAV4CT32_9GAST|nr:hypothetical protein PoB_006153300 [Plakobranchus ocellatus]